MLMGLLTNFVLVISSLKVQRFLLDNFENGIAGLSLVRICRNGKVDNYSDIVEVKYLTG